jgi:hypothetical protein
MIPSGPYGSYLRCRDLGHEWKMIREFDIQRNTARRVVSFLRSSECGRCKATREQEVSVPAFEIVRSRIKYPKDFTNKGSRPTKSRVRKERFEKTFGNI